METQYTQEEVLEMIENNAMQLVLFFILKAKSPEVERIIKEEWPDLWVILGRAHFTEGKNASAGEVKGAMLLEEGISEDEYIEMIKTNIAKKTPTEIHTALTITPFIS